MTNGKEKLYYEVESSYSHLGNGQTNSGQVCPACQGGATKEGSFSVSRSGDLLLFTCHRASCSFKGSIRLGPGGQSSEGKARTTGKPNVKVSQPVEASLKFLAAKSGLPRASLETAGLGWVEEGAGNYSRRFYFPIFGPDYRERGAVYRSYEGATPKALTKLFDDDAVASCWYKWLRTSNLLVLVEDQVSAIKIAPYHHALALLGTNLNEAKIEEILAQDPKYDRIYLCLDNDATMEAVKTQLRWRDRVPNIVVLGLEKDVKDMDNEEFANYLKRIT